MATCTAQDAITNSSCLGCLTPKQLSGLQIQLLCDVYSSSGSGSGSGGILCGAVDPVNDPTTQCAIYYNTATGGLWCWNDLTSAWVKYIS